jgi:RNA polymerase sigma-70 factor, ECF subfamily
MLAVDIDLEPLVQQARAGRPEAWDRLFHRYQLPLYSYVHELVQDEQASLDIVQETFVRALRHLGSLREDRRFGSWLFGIAHQQCLQQWRRLARELRVREDDIPEDLPDPGPGPDEWLLRHEQEEQFLAALAKLSAGHRSVLLLRFLEEFSLEEIAAATGLPQGTVKSRLHYAKQALRRALEESS